MNWFDLLVIILAVGITVMGFRDGFVGQAVKLGGFLIALAVLAAFSGTLLAFALSFERVPPVISIGIVFGGVFMLFMLVFQLIAVLLSKMIAITPAQFIDAGFGAALGMVKGLFFCGFLALIISKAPADSFYGTQYRESLLAGKMSGITASIMPILRSAASSIERRLEGIREKEHQFEERDNVQPPIGI
jgi:uncharacterized membrane protein required for colicin V production